MELRQLRHFASLVDARSFSVAARELRISQPTLTRSISTLENRLGAKLFERSRRGTQPTAAGLEFYRYATTILNDCRRASEEVASIRSGGVGKVRVGVGASYVSLIEEVTACIAEEMPSIDLEIIEGLIENLIDPLIDGRIDVILTTFAPVAAQPSLVLEPLLEVAPMVVAGARHPIARKRSPTVKDLAGAEWISVDQPYTMDVLIRLFTAQRLPAPRPVRSGSISLIKRLVASGQFLTLLPERAVLAEMRRGTLRRVPVTIPVLPVDGGIIYLDRSVRSAAVERVIQLMRDACAREGR